MGQVTPFWAPHPSKLPDRPPPRWSWARTNQLRADLWAHFVPPVRTSDCFSHAELVRSRGACLLPSPSETSQRLRTQTGDPNRLKPLGT